MAGPIRGSIEHFIDATALTTASVQGFFVNVYNFLNNNTGTLGIQRLAYNTGSQDTGMTTTRAMNYWDQPQPAGQNAFAAFRFLSASVPFDVMIQWAGAATFGAAPGAPGLVFAAATANSFGIAMAQRSDGVTAWNGSTNNNGSDVKGASVWTSSSLTAYYPRSNDPSRAGAHGSLKQNAGGFTALSSIQTRHHIIADYDNLVILYDVGAANQYVMIAFGAYTPMSGLNPTVPYFMVNRNATLPYVASTQIGTPAGTTDAGGVSHPSLALSGTCSFGADRLGGTSTTFGFFQNTSAQPNKAFSTQRFDEFPLMIGIFESPLVGLVGQHFSFFRETFNIATHDTNSDLTRTCFGTNTVPTIKTTTPWHSGTTPGTGATRTGVQFGI